MTIFRFSTINTISQEVIIILYILYFSLDSSVVGPLPLKECHSDLVIVNQEALNNENADKVVKQSITPHPPISPTQRLAPVIRVWEGDLELIDTAGQRVETPPNKSHPAWEGDSNHNTESASEATTGNPTLINKATSMAHELVHLMTSNESRDEDGSDIELDDVFGHEKRNKKNKENQLKLLNPKNSDDDDAELHSLSSLEDNDRPLFQSSQLALDSTRTTSADLSPMTTEENRSEMTTTSNVYTREDSAPVVIEMGDRDIKKPSFSEQTDTTLDVRLGDQQQKSSRKSSRTSINSNTSSKHKEENYEMQDIRVDSADSRHLASSSEAHEGSGLLSSGGAVGMTTQYGKLLYC